MTGSVAPLKVVEGHQPAPTGQHPDNQKSNRRSKETDFPKDIWDAVHAEYRAGVRYGKLEEIYGIPVELIVRRKQRENWRPDLRKDVQAETFAALAVGSSSSGASDEEVVQAAAKRGAEVVQQHRVVLADALAAISTLAVDLRRAAAAHSKGELAGVNMAFLGPKETLAEAALKLGNALARVVPLERKAFGLDDGNDARPYEETLRDWYAQRRAEQGKAGG